MSKLLMTAMYGLIYPAVLGTFFMQLLPLLKRESFNPPRERLLRLTTGIAITLFFIGDFVIVQTFQIPYSVINFLIDLFIVFFLYKAFEALDLKESEIGHAELISLDGQAYKTIAKYMAGVFCLFATWTYLARGLDNDPHAWNAIWSFHFLAIAIFGALARWSRPAIVVLFILLLGVVEMVLSFQLANHLGWLGEYLDKN